MSSRLVTLCLSFALVAAASGAADANRSFHERVKAEELREESGEVVGLELTLTLRPLDGQTTVRVGLGKKGGIAESDDFRDQAADPGKGYLLHQFPERSDLVDGKPEKVTLTVKYADAPGLSPGDEVEVVSAWTYEGSYWHIWGARTTLNRSATLVRLPRAKEVRTSRRLLRAPEARSRAARIARAPGAQTTRFTRARPARQRTMTRSTR